MPLHPNLMFPLEKLKSCQNFQKNQQILVGKLHFNETRQKVLKVAKIKDANYGCKDEGNDDGKVDDNGGFLFLSY